ncbi:MbtH family protein [Streptomyces sp. RB6PN25]|uniref:MbtH family protein n=1 Tax=Streptomyces humicola TaxID=2953240 RepID=A0ABT1Q0S9_9ACTN|nr:MbtH family protein [Streptomyces humicola]MCQ4083517.1 MbtH family protein [Streptomyces humicola]
MNPFDDPDGQYLVVVNAEGQHSLWPADLARPAGWEAVFGPAGRPECLEHVDQAWTDMRPKSLVRAMSDESAGRPS